jgi:chromosome segregation ATPase
MTEEEYLRMKNLLNTVIEQQVSLSENQAKAETRLSGVEDRMSRLEDRINRNAEAIASLLTLAEMHEQERVEADKRLNARFEKTDDRINALVSVVERYITRG